MTTRNTDRVKPESIYVVGPRRDLDESMVSQLMDSIRELGLLHPITVRYDEAVWDEAEREEVASYVLVAGRHRLEAAKRLGLLQVDVTVVPWDARRSRLWELSENLHRAELSPLERDELVAEWTRLSAELRQEQSGEVSRHADAKPKGGRPEGGIRAAARTLGISEANARRAVKVANLSPEAKEAARETGMDAIRSVLLRAADHGRPEDQVEAIREAARQRDKSGGSLVVDIGDRRPPPSSLDGFEDDDDEPADFDMNDISHVARLTQISAKHISDVKVRPKDFWAYYREKLMAEEVYQEVVQAIAVLEGIRREW